MTVMIALNVNGAVMRVELKILKSDVRPQIKISGKSYGTDGASRGSLSYSGFINVYNYIAKRCFAKIQKPPETYIPHTKISPTR